MKFIAALLILFLQLLFLFPANAFAATTRVNLLTSDNFAVLSGSALSDSVTTSVINGDVGLSPGGGASITGLTCAEMNGTIYDTNGGYTGNGGGSTACRQTNPGKLTTAQNDLTTAYNDAAGRTVTSTVATELGGTILTDGVYNSAAGTFGITGTLTLDGGGNADSVFIFKMASTLITASSSKVVLINGAQACNVYWQVGSAATLGTGTNFVGNILATSAITDNGGSTINGRLLEQTGGSVTLSNTHITKQECAAGTAGGLSSTSGSSSGGGTGGNGIRVCPTLNYIAPIIIESRRINANSIFISWGPYSGINTFVVQYGLENGNWLYSTNVTGFSTTLNDLPPNQPFWVHIAATDGCSTGTYGTSMLVGGTMTGSAGSASAANFLLPNTGFAPSENTTPWNIAIVIGSILFISSLFMLLKKRTI